MLLAPFDNHPTSGVMAFHQRHRLFFSGVSRRDARSIGANYFGSPFCARLSGIGDGHRPVNHDGERASNVSAGHRTRAVGAMQWRVRAPAAPAHPYLQYRPYCGRKNPLQIAFLIPIVARSHARVQLTAAPPALPAAMGDDDVYRTVQAAPLAAISW